MTEARAVYRQGEEAVFAVLVNFSRRLQELEAKLSMNSAHSSKPPSTDNKLTKSKTTHKMSTGSIYNFLSTHHQKLKIFEDDVKSILLQEELQELLHSDETGININTKLNWRSCISTLKKNNIAVLQGRRDTLNSKAYIPVRVGC